MYNEIIIVKVPAAQHKLNNINNNYSLNHEVPAEAKVRLGEYACVYHVVETYAKRVLV